VQCAADAPTQVYPYGQLLAGSLLLEQGFLHFVSPFAVKQMFPGRHWAGSHWAGPLGTTLVVDEHAGRNAVTASRNAAAKLA